MYSRSYPWPYQTSNATESPPPDCCVPYMSKHAETLMFEKTVARKFSPLTIGSKKGPSYSIGALQFVAETEARTVLPLGCLQKRSFAVSF